MRADDVRAFGFLTEKLIDFGDGAVEGDDLEAVVVHVEDEVLAHDSQADESNIRCRLHVFTFSKSKENDTMARTLRQIIFGRAKGPAPGPRLAFEAKKEHDQVNDEEQHNHAFQQ